MPEFDSAQVQQLVAGPMFTEDQSQRTCPACGAKAVRTYMYRYSAGSRSSLITYSWCAACRRHKGWTGPDTGLRFTDPLENRAKERRAREKDFEGFLQLLDELWDKGELPQRFD